MAEYEYSALLYLTEIGADFTGGSLIFHDAEKDCHVAPRPGIFINIVFY